MPDYDLKDFEEGEYCWEDKNEWEYNNEQSYEKDSQVKTWWYKIYRKFQRS